MVHPDTDTLKRLLTFPSLPFLHDGLQPLLLLLWGLGHADEPLVLGRVVDLPAVVHYVPAAVVVSCEAEEEKSAQTRVRLTLVFIKLPLRGGTTANQLFSLI